MSNHLISCFETCANPNHKILSQQISSTRAKRQAVHLFYPQPRRYSKIGKHALPPAGPDRLCSEPKGAWCEQSAHGPPGSIARRSGGGQEPSPDSPAERCTGSAKKKPFPFMRSSRARIGQMRSSQQYSAVMCAVRRPPEGSCAHFWRKYARGERSRAPSTY